MAPNGIETIIGVTRDPVFGQAVMFGLRGIFAELFRDVAFRAALPYRQLIWEGSIRLRNFRNGTGKELPSLSAEAAQKWLTRATRRRCVYVRS
jgi:ATP-grasp domain